MACRIKICGITNLADARFCAAAGAEYLGFIQYRRSPRYVPAELAGEIRAWLHGTKTVGVFVDEDADSVNRAVEIASFDLVQLHGAEPPPFCAKISAPVIKAFRVAESNTEALLRKQMEAFEKVADFFLLDTYHPVLHGGTGKTFEWSVASAICREFPVFLAGGLGPHNVSDALRQVRPWALDMSSGVETTPGKKDYALVEAVFQSSTSA